MCTRCLLTPKPYVAYTFIDLSVCERGSELTRLESLQVVTFIEMFSLVYFFEPDSLFLLKMMVTVLTLPIRELFLLLCNDESNLEWRNERKKYVA